MTTINLDKLAAECAQGMVKDTPPDKIETLERLTTKALGVLQEQGIYALLLFLFSRSSDEKLVAPYIRAQLYQAVLNLPAYKGNHDLAGFNADTPSTTILLFFTRNILKDDALDTTLLVRDLYEQTLTYARYGAKAAGG